MKRARRPAGLRVANPRSARIHRQEKLSLKAAEKAQDAFAKLSLASLSSADLQRLWRNRGGSVREFVSGELQLLAANGEEIVRGTPDAVGDWLRARLVKIDSTVTA
jgi:hypothetical protein